LRAKTIIVNVDVNQEFLAWLKKQPVVVFGRFFIRHFVLETVLILSIFVYVLLWVS